VEQILNHCLLVQVVNCVGLRTACVALDALLEALLNFSLLVVLSFQEFHSAVVGQLDVVASEVALPVLPRDRASHLECRHAHFVAHHVRLTYQVVGLQALARVHLQHALDQFASAIIKCLVHVVMASLDPLIKILLAGAAEGERANQHHVQQNATRPDVHWVALVVALASNLWSHVGRRATENLEALVRCLSKHREAHINQFDHPCAFFNKHIIQLNIAMDDRNLSMEVKHGFNDLAEDTSGRELSHLSIRQLSNVLSQRDSLNVISNHENLLG